MSCKICGQTGEVMHHIVARGSIRDKEIADIPENLIELCYRCHDSIHRGGMIARLKMAVEKLENAKGYVRKAEKKKNGRI